MSFIRWFTRRIALFFPVFMLPIINDISTDLEDVPKFVKAKIGRLPESFKAQIRRGYPDLKPLTFPKTVPFSQVYAAGKAASTKMTRWTITYAEDGIIEGVAVTAIMRYRDDFVFRFVEKPDGTTVVDGRSKSRLGKGDFGANAARIRAFFAALEAELGQTSKM